ncbi:inactive hydroxysteroid dehydrogenase-like protein 1 isoform X2 [Onthophagus taurus]|nr:inactive hydroxysteroid dehydrogenase-like protein 1 isoform X2 [Onthophagus taurus]
MDALYILLLAIIGAITLLFIILDPLWDITLSLRAILSPYLRTDFESDLVKKYGQWALVTGCTDGIGKEYAKQLANRGLNIVLVSRSPEKLSTVSQEIVRTFNVKTKVIVADFSKGAPIYEKIRLELGNLEIGILVNNVGSQYTFPMYVGEVPEKTVWDIINVNVAAVTMMTKMLIEDMKARKKGAIVNVSSGAELQPLPLMTLYAASKVYIRNFTRALQREYSNHGITIQHVSPMFVNTKMNDFSRRLRTTGWFVPNAESYAKYAVSTLGKLDHTTGYWTHGIQYFFVGMVPEWIRITIGHRLNKSLRKEYYSNQQPVQTNC